MQQTARVFVRDELLKLIYPEAKELVESHRAAGDYLLMISASESFLVAPIAQALHIDGVSGINSRVPGIWPVLPIFGCVANLAAASLKSSSMRMAALRLLAGKA